MTLMVEGSLLLEERGGGIKSEGDLILTDYDKIVFFI